MYLCSIEFVTTGSVYFDVVLCGSYICNVTRRIIVGWVPSTVIKIIVGMY